jgi:hypothetical protein
MLAKIEIGKYVSQVTLLQSLALSKPFISGQLAKRFHESQWTKVK